MNIFDQYGIKEVADVTLYSIHKKKDGSGEVYYVPALYLDTLKISTVEKTAENVWAEGGQGNARLINWDFGKQINVSLEDALCTPASLGLCWNGTLSADWKDSQLNYNTDICYCQNPLTRLSRMEKCIFPGANVDRSTISHLLPKLSDDEIDASLDLLLQSSVIDGTEVRGHGIVQGHVYGWRMAIETKVKSIAVIPDKFFDIRGRSYPIDQNRKVSVSSLPNYLNYKDAIIYKINSKTDIKAPRAEIIFDDAMEGGITAAVEPDKKRATTETTEPNVLVKSYPYKQNRTFYSLFGVDAEDKPIIADELGSIYNIGETPREICEAQYLAIIVDSNDDYYALLGFDTAVDGDLPDSDTVTWTQPKTPVNVYQFKNIDMWLRFDSINALAYFLITKYNDDIKKIVPVTIDPTTMLQNGEDITPVVTEGDNPITPSNDSEEKDDWAVNKNITEVTENTDGESRKAEGKLWAYVNPRTMQPYADDYWFHQGEPFYIKSLTLAPKGKRIKGNKITVRADQWPGMYMMVGETYIRSRDTGEDECRM